MTGQAVSEDTPPSLFDDHNGTRISFANADPSTCPTQLTYDYSRSRYRSSHGNATGGGFSYFSDLREMSGVNNYAGTLLKIEELAEIYVLAWRAALTQEGRFLAPRPVFEGVTTGVDLLKEVCALCPFLWTAEKKLKEDSMKAELRNCYRAMKDEADILCQVEYLAVHGTSKHLKQMDQLLSICRRRRYAHDAVFEVQIVGADFNSSGSS
eukprot:Gregarina_sp_Poly_1__4818@NODE_2569_length_1971_cov_71_073004_g1003_i2_p2_GENE_NODE_2569_length_1971_cov_71_073004_g1003_i2NODE_2569_length_1971_cov_71_073004_g1003_i2_p2_ORF_typecomplete_len210_score31_43_NODE_2569_length_1971_cov_71_073004_g1003_i2322951